MGGFTGQALGMAVGAAVGTAFGSPVLGAQIGAAGAGYLGESLAGGLQTGLDKSMIALNREQAQFKASEQSALHARNFRKALASQLAVASMRGGAGSVAAQFGQESYRNFLEDQRAIEMGAKIADVSGSLSAAEAEAKRNVREQNAAARAASTAAQSFDFNLLNPR